MNCLICLENIEQQVKYVNSCQHSFHSECYQAYLENKIHNFYNQDLKCPMEGCEVSIDLSHLNPELYQLYVERCFQNHLIINHQRYIRCSTLDCAYVVEYVPCQPKPPQKKHQKCGNCMKFFCICDKLSYKLNYTDCGLCKAHICFLCKQSHRGLNCKEHQHNLKVDQDFVSFVHYLKKQKLRKCPQCNLWVMKNEGCDHMTCRCTFQFCYKCNGVYGNCQCNNKKLVIEIPYPKVPIVYKPKPYSHRLQRNEATKTKVALKPKVFVFGKTVTRNFYGTFSEP